MRVRGSAFVLAASLVWLAAATYASLFVDRGWIPHDEGTIAQSAERVLAGEVPHRDFDEVYTGGLTYLHAASMRVLGTTLFAPRWTLFVAFLIFVSAVLAVARRVSVPAGAVTAAALAVVWSVPNYFAALPSWYTLFFATAGVLGLLCFIDSGRRIWLVLAGVCGGLSILVKITGVYYVAAAVLFLVYLEIERPADGALDARLRSALVAVPAALVAGWLTYAIWTGTAGSGVLTLFLGPFLLCLFIVRPPFSPPQASTRHSMRDTAFVTRVGWFSAGLLLPIAAFVAWYWQQGAVLDLIEGVFVLPQRRLGEARFDPPPIAALGLAVPYVALLIAPPEWIRRWATWLALALVPALTAVLVMAGDPVVYRAIWTVARAIPLAAVVALVWCARRLSPEQRAPAVLLVTMAAFTALVQFPYATPTYFYYVAPVAALAVVSLVSVQRSAARPHLVIAAFFFLFAVGFANTSYAWNLGRAFVAYDPESRLDLQRARGLRVLESDKQTYEALVATLRAHAAGGTIYAGPDCPEVYFLSGFSNPTRAIFDFLSPERHDAIWMEALLDSAPVRAAVINTDPRFSPPLDPGVLSVLERRFPASTTVGRFVVRFEAPVR